VTIRRIIIPLAIAGVGALAVPSLASAHSNGGYTISRDEARHYALGAGETRYAANGVDATGSRCYAQYVSGRGYHRSRANRYEWHRWACGWVGWDRDRRRVYGEFLMAGHTDGTYGFRPLSGGLRWAR
jgi:hypothetical protein